MQQAYRQYGAMSMFQRLAEQKIKEAIEKGEFDNLEGTGKPIDHTGYFSAPPSLRMSYHILKNAGVLPEEVQLLQSVHQLTNRIKETLDAEEKERITREKVLLENRIQMLRERRILDGF